VAGVLVVAAGDMRFSFVGNGKQNCCGKQEFRDETNRKVDELFSCSFQCGGLCHAAHWACQQWLWYSGDRMVHAGKKDLNFRKMPYRLHSFLPAAGLGLGHYRVTVLIDGKIIDTQEFNIVP
jgi:hypothetical protein